jgi:diguanylate cyclase (GGDEF)-like protein
VFQDITESRAIQRDLAHSARHDSLTGLAHRSAFLAKLAQACELARDERRVHALCFIDLDRFKAVNDRAGHAAGDALLREATSLIKRACRVQDFLGRIGGDEFALLLPDCSAVDAREVAEKIVSELNDARFIWSGVGYRIGASVGVTSIDGRSDPVKAISEADAACYAAKAAGRNRVKIHAKAMHVAPARGGGGADRP